MGISIYCLFFINYCCLRTIFNYIMLNFRYWVCNLFAFFIIIYIHTFKFFTICNIFKYFFQFALIFICTGLLCFHFLFLGNKSKAALFRRFLIYVSFLSYVLCRLVAIPRLFFWFHLYILSLIMDKKDVKSAKGGEDTYENN